MGWLTPHPGLVIRYSYLWKREADSGRQDGTKDRPCAIVVAVDDADGERQVIALPITHAPPSDPSDAIEIPAVTKQRLGLDFDRSWIVLTEANEFVWPGPDLRPIPGRDADAVSYGVLPPRFFTYVRDQFLARYEAAAMIRRTT